MTEDLDLCKLLKGHEGEKFYSMAHGEVELVSIDDQVIKFKGTFRDADPIYFFRDGSMYVGGECILFPEKNNKDWGPWIMARKIESVILSTFTKALHDAIEEWILKKDHPNSTL